MKISIVIDQSMRKMRVISLMRTVKVLSLKRIMRATNMMRKMKSLKNITVKSITIQE